MAQAKRPLKFETPDQLETVRILRDHVIRILVEQNVHGRIDKLSPGIVTVRVWDLHPNELFRSLGPKFVRPVGRWRLYYPSTDGLPPVVFRLDGHRKPRSWGQKTNFVISSMSASFVEAPFVL